MSFSSVSPTCWRKEKCSRSNLRRLLATLPRGWRFFRGEIRMAPVRFVSSTSHRSRVAYLANNTSLHRDYYSAKGYCFSARGSEDCAVHGGHLDIVRSCGAHFWLLPGLLRSTSASPGAGMSASVLFCCRYLLLYVWREGPGRGSPVWFPVRLRQSSNSCGGGGVYNRIGAV